MAYGDSPLETGMESFYMQNYFVLDIKRPNLLAGKIWFPAKPFLGKSPKLKTLDCQFGLKKGRNALIL